MVLVMTVEGGRKMEQLAPKNFGAHTQSPFSVLQAPPPEQVPCAVQTAVQQGGTHCKGGTAVSQQLQVHAPAVYLALLLHREQLGP